MSSYWTTSSTSCAPCFWSLGERVVEVVHGEHDTQVAERVHRGVPVIGDRRRRKKSRELEPAVAVRRPHHGDLDALVAQPSDAPGPLSFDHGSPLELEAQLGEKRDGDIERLHHDADVVHPLKRHAAILAVRNDHRCLRAARDQVSAPLCGNVPRRCRDGREERLTTGHEDTHGCRRRAVPVLQRQR